MAGSSLRTHENQLPTSSTLGVTGENEGSGHLT